MPGIIRGPKSNFNNTHNGNSLGYLSKDTKELKTKLITIYFIIAHKVIST